MTHQPPTPPAVTDEMVEAAVTEFGKCVAAFTAAVHPHDHEITKRAMDDRRAALLALIARARTRLPGREVQLQRRHRPLRPRSRPRDLCGELEDRSVMQQTISLMYVRERLEPSVAEAEAHIARRVAEAEARGRREALGELGDKFAYHVTPPDGKLCRCRRCNSAQDVHREIAEMLARAAGGGTKEQS